MWVKVFTNIGHRFLINLDRVDSIMEGHDGIAQIEWGNGNCQVISIDPTFSELDSMLTVRAPQKRSKKEIKK